MRTLCTVAILVAAWATLAPQQWGGPLSYASTDGVSMLPHFHAGDIVLLRRESSYHVGEVAGYHNADLKVVVMHRIIARHGNRYVFKGDNNNYADSYEPTKSQIVGAEWVHIARAGKVLAKLRSPVIAGLVLGLLWVLSFAPRQTSRRQRRRHRSV